MQAAQAMNHPRPHPGPEILAVGFGTTVAMWAMGYVSRLPALQLPSPLLLVLMLACLFAGGLLLGRHAAAGWGRGALAGLLSAALNLLVLGSLLTGGEPNQIVPSALWWIPGSILVSALIAAAGSLVGSRFPHGHAPYRQWPAILVGVAIVATMLLLAVGGLVTSTGAGLAVVDWPNSFGYNMFLYPFSRMTGPIYYEHAHRLFGALVGLTTLVMALVLQFAEPRAWVRRLAWIVFAMVAVQGLMGGIRVTGGFTLSTSVEDMAPSRGLAMAHGVFGQLCFAMLVAIGAFTSTAWQCAAQPLRRIGASYERVTSVALVALLLGQLTLGAAQRHFSSFLTVHAVTGLAIVTPVVIHVGARAWGLNEGRPRLQRLGLALIGALAVQVVLGVLALLASVGAEGEETASIFEITLATAHQWFGALLLGAAVLLTCWNFRLIASPRRSAG